MKAAVLHETDQPLAIEELHIENPGPNEVLVRTAACGVCHSDRHLMSGSFATDLPSVMDPLTCPRVSIRKLS
jgi:S-(hydroxymethyl)glutathione dehydrogenase/alcohol dehydrogenase